MKLFFLVIFLVTNLWAAPTTPTPQTLPTKSKTYTEEEFKKSLEVEVDKRLRRYNSNNFADLTKEIMAKEEQIKVKERDLMNKEEQINFNSRELEKKIKEFEKDQTKILGCIDRNNEDVKKRVDTMIDVIGNMKPEKAAEVLSVQDSDLAVRILSGLDAKKSSKIFNLMNKEISARLQKQYLDMKK